MVRTVFPEGALRMLGSLGVNPNLVKTVLGSLGVNPNLPESVTGQRVDASPVVMTILWHRIFSRQNMTP